MVLVNNEPESLDTFSTVHYTELRKIEYFYVSGKLSIVMSYKFIFFVI